MPGSAHRRACYSGETCGCSRSTLTLTLALTLTLTSNQVRLLTLDPTLLTRMLALVVTMVFFGVIYIEQRDKVQALTLNPNPKP